MAATLLSVAVGYGLHANAQAITGGLNGTVQPAAGATVLVANPATGFNRTITVGADGRFSLKLLTPGSYRVSVEKGGTVVAERTVTVAPNVSTPVPPFTLGAAQPATLAAIQVTANNTVINPIDVTTPQLSTVYDSGLLHQLPISQTNIYAIPLLNSYARPTNVQGSMLPQIMGAGPTENRYYYNGFDTTYDVTGVGAITFPQEAVTSTEFIPSNSGIEYTSTTGAITAATLRQGSNTFHGGYSVYYTLPTSHLLSPRGKDTWYDINGVRTRYIYQSANTDGGDATNYLWVSGPIVKNKLFFAATLGYESPSVDKSFGATQQFNTSSRLKSGFINVTWNITHNQALDVAYDRVYTNTSTNIFNLAAAYTPSSVSDIPAWSNTIGRSKLTVANYHWYINDNMTLRLMAGYMRFDDNGSDQNVDEPYAFLYNGTTGVSTQLSGGASGYAPYNYYFAKRGFRGIFTWVLGHHTITVGGEKYANTYHFLPTTVPNGYFQYYDYSGLGYGGASLGNGGFIPASGKYGYEYFFSSGGTFISNNYGWYASDNWQATPNLVLSAGVRLDQMRNYSANNVDYLHMNTVSPRVGFAWDVHGDGSLKIGGNAGKYTLPLPSALSYTDAGAETYRLTYFSYTGINPNGTPIGQQQLGSVYEPFDGTVPQLSAIASQHIKNTYQYEFQLYGQQQLTPAWSMLASANVHVLKNLIDQTCDQDGTITNYVRDNGYPDYAGLTSGCIEFNPGRAIVLRDDIAGNGTLSDITIPNSYLGMPGASRKYYGLTFKLAHARTPTQPYYLSLSYTWGHLYGNSDGYVNMTKTTDPADGNTGNYTFREITAGNYGNLAGDIRNQFTANGIYYFPHGFRIGGVFTANTGAPESCLGTYPDAANTNLNSLGAVTHYCNGELVTEGSTWRAPFFWQLDLDFGYDIDLGRAGQLSLDLRITNVTNRNTVLSRSMVVDNGVFAADGTLEPSPSYMAISGLQSPRATFLYARYRF